MIDYWERGEGEGERGRDKESWKRPGFLEKKLQKLGSVSFPTGTKRRKRRGRREGGEGKWYHTVGGSSPKLVFFFFFFFPLSLSLSHSFPSFFPLTLSLSKGWLTCLKLLSHSLTGDVTEIWHYVTITIINNK